MPTKHTLKAQFDAADATRGNFMARARDCALHTHPTMLPPVGTTSEHRIPQSYQALGADGLSNITGKVLLTVFPPNMPFARGKPSARARSDPDVTQEMLEGLETYLYARDLQIHSQIDATKYRTKFRTSFEHTIGVGNSLTQCGGENGDYWFKNYRLDHFVQKRGSDGEVLWTITHERLDPLELSDEDLAAAGLTRDELEKKEGEERLQSLYTKCTRQRGTKTWLITQEINDKIIRTSQEKVSPYLALGYIEVTNEDYSRGLVEEKMGDLRTFNTQNRSLIDWGTAASKVTPVLDEANSLGMTAADLMRPSGETIHGRVVDGVVQGVGFLSTKMAGEINVVLNHAGIIEARLGKQFLLETEAQRKAERVTATEVRRVAQQLEGALGAIYTEIASEIQGPLYARMAYMMERDHILLPIPEAWKPAVDIEILTGLAALGRQVELEKVMGALQLIGPFPGAIEKISLERLVTAVFRGYNLDMADVVKTVQEMQEEKEERMAEQVEAATAQQSIETAGAVVEEGAKQAAATAAAPPAA